MKMLRRTIRVDDRRAVSSVWRIPEGYVAGGGRVLIIAHGAGNHMSSAFINYLHRNLAGRGCLTVKFNFPYAQAGRKAPDRAPVLEHTWRAVFERVRTDAQCAGGRIYLSGKSLGGRMASHIAADTATAPRSLIFFGFPLHPPNHRDTQRAAPLFGIETPMLFIQGTRDPFCDLELLKSVLARLKAPHRLHVIDDGDHSFKLPKRAQRSEKSVWDEIVAAADDWMTYSATRGGG